MVDGIQQHPNRIGLAHRGDVGIDRPGIQRNSNTRGIRRLEYLLNTRRDLIDVETRFMEKPEGAIVQVTRGLATGRIGLQTGPHGTERIFGVIRIGPFPQIVKIPGVHHG